MNLRKLVFLGIAISLLAAGCGSGKDNTAQTTTTSAIPAANQAFIDFDNKMKDGITKLDSVPASEFIAKATPLVAEAEKLAQLTKGAHYEWADWIGDRLILGAQEAKAALAGLAPGTVTPEARNAVRYLASFIEGVEMRAHMTIPGRLAGVKVVNLQTAENGTIPFTVPNSWKAEVKPESGEVVFTSDETPGASLSLKPLKNAQQLPPAPDRIFIASKVMRAIFSKSLFTVRVTVRDHDFEVVSRMNDKNQHLPYTLGVLANFGLEV